MTFLSTAESALEDTSPPTVKQLSFAIAVQGTSFPIYACFLPSWKVAQLSLFIALDGIFLSKVVFFFLWIDAAGLSQKIALEDPSLPKGEFLFPSLKVEQLSFPIVVHTSLAISECFLPSLIDEKLPLLIALEDKSFFLSKRHFSPFLVEELFSEETSLSESGFFLPTLEVDGSLASSIAVWKERTSSKQSEFFPPPLKVDGLLASFIAVLEEGISLTQSDSFIISLEVEGSLALLITVSKESTSFTQTEFFVPSLQVKNFFPSPEKDSSFSNFEFFLKDSVVKTGIFSCILEFWPFESFPSCSSIEQLCIASPEACEWLPSSKDNLLSSEVSSSWLFVEEDSAVSVADVVVNVVLFSQVRVDILKSTLTVELLTSAGSPCEVSTDVLAVDLPSAIHGKESASISSTDGKSTCFLDPSSFFVPSQVVDSSDTSELFLSVLQIDWFWVLPTRGWVWSDELVSTTREEPTSNCSGKASKSSGMLLLFSSKVYSLRLNAFFLVCNCNGRVFPLTSAVILLSCEVWLSSVFFSLMISLTKMLLRLSLSSSSKGFSSLVILTGASPLDPHSEVVEISWSISIPASVGMFSVAFETGAKDTSELSSLATCSESKAVEGPSLLQSASCPPVNTFELPSSLPTCSSVSVSKVPEQLSWTSFLSNNTLEPACFSESVSKAVEQRSWLSFLCWWIKFVSSPTSDTELPLLSACFSEPVCRAAQPSWSSFLCWWMGSVSIPSDKEFELSSLPTCTSESVSKVPEQLSWPSFLCLWITSMSSPTSDTKLSSLSACFSESPGKAAQPSWSSFLRWWMASVSIPTNKAFKSSSLPTCSSESLSKASEQLSWPSCLCWWITSVSSPATDTFEMSSLPTGFSESESKAVEQLCWSSFLCLWMTSLSIPTNNTFDLSSLLPWFSESGSKAPEQLSSPSFFCWSMISVSIPTNTFELSSVGSWSFKSEREAAE